jgi:hypothetical protein
MLWSHFLNKSDTNGLHVISYSAIISITKLKFNNLAYVKNFFIKITKKYYYLTYIVNNTFYIEVSLRDD